jgi:hypothetical protein
LLELVVLEVAEAPSPASVAGTVVAVVFSSVVPVPPSGGAVVVPPGSVVAGVVDSDADG